MKITKQYLMQIIKEEISNVSETDWRDTASDDYHAPQAEAGPYADESKDALAAAVDAGDENAFYDTVDQLLAKGHTMEEIEKMVSLLGDEQ